MSEKEVSLDKEVDKFRSVNDQIALGDLGIRQKFATSIMVLFGIANGAVLLGVGAIFYEDCVQISSGAIRASERIINSQVIMTLLGATTVQLGTVVLTIARAIFPSGRTTETSHTREATTFKDIGSGIRIPSRAADLAGLEDATRETRPARTRRAAQPPVGA